MTPSGYAVVDYESRLLKARKIEALLGGDIAGLELLDLGTGSGFLAEYFRSRGASVIAADRDRDTYLSNIPFTQIDRDSLPFPPARFDVVILNHVIEHVGDEPTQRVILAEISRILKPSGRLYLAVPSKWAIIEPHFRLPLLGALPRPFSNLLVRALRRADEYDCYPLSRSKLIEVLRSSFPVVEDLSPQAVRWMAENEMRGLPQALLKAMPGWLVRSMRPVYPTFVMLCRNR